MSNYETVLVDVCALNKVLNDFAELRGWQKFHSPKNLALALTGEVGELVEIFQWLSEEESFQVAENSQTNRAVRDELADVMIYLVRLAFILDVDLNEAVNSKLISNAIKYPVPQSNCHKT